ncbi:hypothetical protein ACPV4A_06325 [Vibrio rotiferianus]
MILEIKENSSKTYQQDLSLGRGLKPKKNLALSGVEAAIIKLKNKA